MNGHPGVAGPFAGSHSTNPQPPSVQSTTFAFRKRWNQIDWRSLASTDVDKIARDMDFQSLQQSIMNVTFCNIEAEEFRNIDPNFVKLFRLAQLIIEYLLHCQQYLSEQSTGFEQRTQEAQLELEKLKAELSSQATELRTLKKESKKRKKIIQAYQDMLNAGATGVHSCPVCKREFVSKEYLQSHIQRRHPDHFSINGDSAESKRKMVSQEDLEKRLIEQITKQFQDSELQLKEELHKKEHENLQKQANEFEKWKCEEKERMKLEFNAFKEPILSELRAVQQEKAQLEQALLQKQAEIEALSVKKQSHLGHLEGALELDIGSTKQKNAELEQLKQQLEHQVVELQSSMRKQEKSWQKKMQKLSSSYQYQVVASNQKLSVLEQSLQETSLSKKKDKEQLSIHKKQLSLLQKKLSDQEGQLQSQREEISVLRSRESTPSLPPSSPLRVSENPPTGSHLSQVQVHEYHTDTEDSVFDSEDDKDEQDGSQYTYTPLPHRPMIKTKFAHSPEMLEHLKQETESIVSGALKQRGLPKGVTGLSNDEFISKMKSLEQERQQRIQTSYNFVEQRDRLVREVEEITQLGFVNGPCSPHRSAHSHAQESSKSKKVHIPDSVEQRDLAVSLPGPSRSKPPLPTPSRLSSSQTGSSKPSQSVHVSPPQDVTPAADSSHSESVSEDESLSSVTLSPLPSQPLPPKQPTASGIANNDDSPWDSDDSIEVLAAPDAGGRTSSTPIKTRPPLASLIATDPSKKPVGGVPVFQVLSSNGAQNEENSIFPAVTGSTTNLKRTDLKSSLRGESSQTVNPISHTGTSRSALTTVSVDEFADSDFSDLDL